MVRRTRGSRAAAAITAAGALALGAAPAAAQFGPVAPGMARPALLLETDYYAYDDAGAITDPESGDPFDAPELWVNIDSGDLTAPMTLYLYWMDRATESKLYYNLRMGGFVAQEMDLFGTAGSPAAVLPPDLTELELFGEASAFGELPNQITRNTGQYLFCIELRDTAGAVVIARSVAMYNYVDGVELHSGDTEDSETWGVESLHVITGPTRFGTNPGEGPGDPIPSSRAVTVLTVEPGTVILGDNSAGVPVLIIWPGAQIIADGTALQPIVFSSAQPRGRRAAEDTGGFVVSGLAPINQDPETTFGEGSSGRYGGDDPNDSSGVIRYLRVEYGGIPFTSDDELNGIAFQGVGRGTVVEHIQIHFGADDGLEFFGGTVDAKYVLITDAQDDSLDWVLGWTGRLQHVVIIQRTNQSNRGVEADNFQNDPAAEPRSNPTAWNVTLAGNRNAPGQQTDEGDGLKLRRGTLGAIGRWVVVNTPAEAVDVDEDVQGETSLGNGLTITDSIFFDTDGLGDSQAVTEYLQAAAQRNRFSNPMLPDPNSLLQPDVAPLSGSPARTATGSLPNDPFFDATSYTGGVDPADPWIDDGWTTFSDN